MQSYPLRVRGLKHVKAINRIIGNPVVFFIGTLIKTLK